MRGQVDAVEPACRLQPPDEGERFVQVSCFRRYAHRFLLAVRLQGDQRHLARRRGFHGVEDVVPGQRELPRDRPRAAQLLGEGLRAARPFRVAPIDARRQSCRASLGERDLGLQGAKFHDELTRRDSRQREQQPPEPDALASRLKIERDRAHQASPPRANAAGERSAAALPRGARRVSRCAISGAASSSGCSGA